MMRITFADGSTIQNITKQISIGRNATAADVAQAVVNALANEPGVTATITNGRLSIVSSTSTPIQTVEFTAFTSPLGDPNDDSTTVPFDITVVTNDGITVKSNGKEVKVS